MRWWSASSGSSSAARRARSSPAAPPAISSRRWRAGAPRPRTARGYSPSRSAGRPRRARPRGGRHALGALCTHLPSPRRALYLCTPLVAQGDASSACSTWVSRPRAARPGAAQRGQAPARRRGGRAGGAGAGQRQAARSSCAASPFAIPSPGSSTAGTWKRPRARGAPRAARRPARGGPHAGPRPLQAQSTTTFDHDAGDALLRELGALLMRNLRREDVACRYGGEEFVLVLPEASLADGERRAEELRRRDQAGTRLGQGPAARPPHRASFDLAAYPEHGLASDVLSAPADTALYRAKREGRDRVIVAVPAEVPRSR